MGGGTEGSGREEDGAEGGRIGGSWWEREGRVGGMRGEEMNLLLFLCLLIFSSFSFYLSLHLFFIFPILLFILFLFSCTSHSPSLLLPFLFLSSYHSISPLPSHLIFFPLLFLFSHSPTLPSSPPLPPSLLLFHAGWVSSLILLAVNVW